ncbi:MAG: sigma factor-like helix-turn-helix DNA-binding protein [Stenotrophomonas geniculata]
MFLEFVRDSRPWLYRFLFSREVSANDIDDIAQHCMERLTRYHRFHQALSTLPRCSREVYLLNRVDGISYSQIARHRSVTSKTIEKQMSRASQDLRKKLNTNFVQFCDYS